MLCTCDVRTGAFASCQRPTRTLCVALDVFACKVASAEYAARLQYAAQWFSILLESPNVNPARRLVVQMPILSTAISRAAGSSSHPQLLTAHLACIAEQRTPNSIQTMWRLAVPLLLIGCAAAQYPLEVGLVPNDQYTADAAPAPYGTEGWRTGRSTFFDGSDQFKSAYLAR